VPSVYEREYYANVTRIAGVNGVSIFPNLASSILGVLEQLFVKDLERRRAGFGPDLARTADRRARFPRILAFAGLFLATT